MSSSSTSSLNTSSFSSTLLPSLNSILLTCLHTPVLSLSTPTPTTLHSKLSLQISRESNIKQWLEKKREEYKVTVEALRIERKLKEGKKANEEDDEKTKKDNSVGEKTTK
ncbi:hypothetical protein TL16_g12432 [Triparma laevis f. inornata]|uniref:Uncharacterized protein n=1 Tax=Triparma laevis f. inornata TaxID=1714386 RepID=A0A9W7BUP1_9STRA|nr:hypothetical protein TL16_g12432 [Triparma laevis f. inornata]